MSEASAVIFAAFIAAAAALWIGWLQGQAIRQQNRIAAFDRRFEAFLQVQASMERAFIGSNPIDMEAIFELNRALRICWFIFPKPLSKRLKEIRDRLVEVRSLKVQIWDAADNQREDATRADLDQYHAALRCIIAEWETLQETFHIHMSFDH